jgi:hypothetical protein
MLLTQILTSKQVIETLAAITDGCSSHSWKEVICLEFTVILLGNPTRKPCGKAFGGKK